MPVLKICSEPCSRPCLFFTFDIDVISMANPNMSITNLMYLVMKSQHLRQFFLILTNFLASS